MSRLYATAHPAALPRPGPDPDAVVLGVLDEVPHDEEVGAEAHVGDDLELVGQAVGGVRRAAGRPIGGGPLRRSGGAGSPWRRVKPSGRGNSGSCGLPNSMVTSARSAIHSVLSHADGDLAEQVPHLLGGLQVVLVTLEVEALGVAHERAGLDAQQRVVGQVVLAVGVVAVVGGQERRADPPSDVDQLGVGLVLGRAARGPAARRTGCPARRCPAGAPAFSSAPASSPCTSDWSTCPPRHPVVAMRPPW